MRLLFRTACLAALLLLPIALPASAQYMYLDSNANGVHDDGDRLNPNGTATTVDVWLFTNQNRDGTIVECNVDPLLPLNMNSYVVNLKASGGEVTYADFVNGFPLTMTTSFGEANAGAGEYKNGFGGPATSAVGPGGPFKICTLTITGTSGAPSILINDINTDSQDFTSFGTRCDGNDFDSTYKLSGPGGGSDWTDADGLDAAPGGNAAPTLTAPENAVGAENNLVTITADATDPDATDLITITQTNNATFLNFSHTPSVSPASATLSGTPPPGSVGVYTINWSASDPTNPAVTATTTLTINPANRPPELDPIGDKTADQGVQLIFTAFAADPDPGQTLSFSLDAGAPEGATISDITGTFTWTPAPSQIGPNPVTIRVTDNGVPPLSDFETITITVQGVATNEPPVLDPIGDKTVDEGSLLTFTATASDPDVGQVLAFALDAGAPTGAAIDPSSGVFNWTPTEDQGPAVHPITVRVTDNGTPLLSDSETIQVTVNEVAPENQPPVLDPIGDKTVDELALLAFTATATDPDAGDLLTFSLDAGAPTGAVISPAGLFSWTPTEAQGPGNYPITVRVSDGTLSDFEAITVTVNVVNDPPVLNGVIGNKTVDEQAPLFFSANAGDQDVEQTLTFSLDAGAPAGATIETTTGNFSWIPTEDQGPGVYPITVRVTDDGSPALSDFEAIQVTVNEVNVAPVLAGIGNQVAQVGAELSFTATATDADLPANILVFSLDAGAPAGATINSSTGVFSWTPGAGDVGTHQVTVRVMDDGTPPLSDFETILIEVQEVVTNQPPVLDPIGDKTVDELALLGFTATASDPDAGQTLSFSVDVGAPAGAIINPAGTFTWTPNEEQGPGVSPITVRVTDDGTPALSDFELIQVTVNEVNVAPVLVGIGNQVAQVGAELTFTATATDADLPANVLAFSLDPGAPAGATINSSTGAFSWTPGAGDVGTHQATVRVTDDGVPPLSDFETISIEVQEVVTNQPPVLDPIGDKTVDELALLGFTATASDPDAGQTLSFSVDVGAPAGAVINPAGTFTWTPNEEQGPGVSPITVRVTDDGTPALSDFEAIQVTVDEVNVAPVLAGIGNQVAQVGAELAFTATATDADLPANVLAFSLDPGAPAGATINSSTGAFSWTPGAGDVGTHQATVRVTDDGVPPLSDFETISIEVQEVVTNQPPVLNPIGDKTVDEGSLLTFTATATDPDAGDVLTFSLDVGAPAGAIINPAGTFTWTPNEEQGPGVSPITVRVTDDGTPALSDFEAIQVTVNEVDGGGPEAAVFFHGGHRTTRLGSGKPTTCVQIEPVNGSFALGDVNLSSIVMQYQGSEISGTAEIDKDMNHNGVQEIKACFSKDNLRVLFRDLPEGENSVEVTLEGELLTGGTFSTTVTHRVIGSDRIAGRKNKEGDDGVAGKISAHPNPLNPETVLYFTTSKAGRVKVRVYDLAGRLVRTLQDADSPAGRNQIRWDGSTSNGNRTASGVYYMRVSSVDGNSTLRVTVLK